MNFPFFIARRYLVSRKSHNIINVISAISAIGVMAGTMALIIILSVFNGFEDLVKSLFNTFNPDLMITSKEGKTLDLTSIPEEELRNIPGLISYTQVIQEKALLKYGEEQYIATLKGVDSNFFHQNMIEQAVINGSYPKKNADDFAIFGYGVAINLGINLLDFTRSVHIYFPRRTAKNFNLVSNPFNIETLLPSAVFSLQQEIDDQFVIVPISLLQNLLEYKNEISHIEIRLREDVDTNEAQQSIQQILGDQFEVKNRYQQEELLYKIMRSEKWAIFFILAFIIIIASFNLIGSLSMIILDKKKDIAILYSMGAGVQKIKRIFLTNGLLINLSGVLIGMLLGLLVCWLQIQFGLIRLGSESGAFIISHYPVKLKILDFIFVLLMVIVIGLGASWFSVRKISKKYLDKNLAIYSRAS